MQISAVYWSCGRDISVDGTNVDKTALTFKDKRKHMSDWDIAWMQLIFFFFIQDPTRL